MEAKPVICLRPTLAYHDNRVLTSQELAAELRSNSRSDSKSVNQATLQENLNDLTSLGSPLRLFSWEQPPLGWVCSREVTEELQGMGGQALYLKMMLQDQPQPR